MTADQVECGGGKRIAMFLERGQTSVGLDPANFSARRRDDRFSSRADFRAYPVTGNQNHGRRQEKLHQ
jgi:hypothetical protein